MLLNPEKNEPLTLMTYKFNSSLMLKYLGIISIVCAGLTSVVSAETGVDVSYRLPNDGDLPRTYLVTVAITDKQNTDWIISTFVAGQPRTVTHENGGLFTEVWDGLDENFMPNPPGTYGVKGIYSPASKWPIDDEWHSITPKFAGGVSGWLPSPEDPDHWKEPLAFGGDPVNAPLRDVDVAPNGIAVFYYQYLENGKNNPTFDLKKPVGPEQFIQAFNSGGAAGGFSTATDGETVWSAGEEGGPSFIYRTDQKPFGKESSSHRKNITLAVGKIMSMDAWKDSASGKTYVYIAQRGKIIEAPKTNPKQRFGKFSESREEFINQIFIQDGVSGEVLQKVDVSTPHSIIVNQGFLYALHQKDEQWQISRILLESGLTKGNWLEVFKVPDSMVPADMELDSRGRIYLSDSDANKVYQVDHKGELLRSYGRLTAQKPGSYDPLTLMAPSKLATWRDPEGKDRLIITEAAGPNRVSEWSADTGELIRDFPTYQTKANSGYCVDPADPSLVYVPGHQDWITRYKVDYDKHQWTIDAVWPGVPSGQRKDMEKPTAVRTNDNTLYLASERHALVYRLNKAGDRWIKSAGVILHEGEDKQPEYFLWNDANGNGETDDEELRPTELPGKVLTYHGQRFLQDLSYVAPAHRGQSLWRLAPSSFDAYGNPVFTEWQKVLTDPIFVARAEGKTDAIYGGNELTDNYNSDWMQADGSMENGFYIQARGGKNFTANFGAQHKISRYIPDGKGGYKLKWRVGRTKLSSLAKKGEIEGGMRLYRPINGILTVVDQSRSGLFLYTEEGLYIDTLFPPGTLNKEIGVYRQPGEFFAGSMVPNPDNGKIYYAAGKYTPLVYEMENWSLENNPIKPLTTLPKELTIRSNQIADALPMAVTLRGGAGKASIASFAPALGGVQMDGSLVGWESAEPVIYQTSDEQMVNVRCLYDPEHLYLRWHVRVGGEFESKPLPPLERIFTHDQESDTVSFYIQGDQNAPAKAIEGGRPGDVRIVFGLFKKDGKLEPVAVGMYPEWKGKGAQLQAYRSPVGEVIFQHVGAVAGAQLNAKVDEDGRGYVMAAAIPRSAIPAISQPFSGNFKTLINFSANLGGHSKFWWANSDGSANVETYDEPSEARLYPGSWAPAQFKGLSEGTIVRNWQILGPFGGPGAEEFSKRTRSKEPVKKFFNASTYTPDDGKVDLNAVYEGKEIQGYWKDRGTLQWQAATIADLDTRIVLGDTAQVWYGATWIYSPEEMSIEFQLQGHFMTYIRWSLNGESLNLEDPDKDYERDPDVYIRIRALKEVTLKQGWNQVYFRAYNVGYAPFKIGLILKAPEEQLWPLKFSNQPSH